MYMLIIFIKSVSIYYFVIFWKLFLLLNNFSAALTILEMLNKDLKILKGTQITVAMSTITMNLEVTPY